MNTKKKKIIYLSIAGLVCAVIVLTASSFALWQVTRKQTNFNAMATACLDLTINNESSSITMDYAYPVTDSEGLDTSGYSFTVTNNCNQPVSYAIGIESVDDNSGKQFVGNSYIDFSLDGKAPVAFSTLDTVTSDSSANYTIRETRSLAIRKVPANGTRTHTIRMWLDEDTPLTEQNKTFVSKVTLTGGQGIEGGCYSVNSSGVLYDYDTECGTAAVIPASVNGYNVTRIANGAFKALSPEFQYQNGTREEINANIASSTCVDVGGVTEPCKVDFGLNVSPLVGRALGGDDSVLGDLTINDLWITVYENLSEAKQEALSSAILQILDDYNILKSMQRLGFDPDDISIYYVSNGNQPGEDLVGGEFYASIENNNGTFGVRDEIGKRTATGNIINKLAISSLDLSQAIYLEKIDSAAFSNVPNITEDNVSTALSDLDAIPTGLTSLTFGNNSRAIDFGGGAFAKSHLQNLDIYTSYTLLKDLENIEDYNDLYVIIGAFGYSVIENLTVKPTATKTVFEGTNDNSILFGSLNESKNLNKINNVIISSGITGLDNYAFGDGSVYNVTFPNTLTSIGYKSMTSYKGTNLTLPNSLQTIGKAAFYWYSGHNSNLVIPASVKSIGDQAFDRYRGDTITFNEGLESIGNDAFRCYSGAGPTIPSTIQTLGTNGGSVFSFFEGTANINMTEANFNANVIYSPYWNLRGTNHFLSN